MARRATITNHYYLELTPEQWMDPRWYPDYRPTWDAFFINRCERALARYEEDDPPNSNFNEAGRRLWWGGRTLQSIMDYITAGDNPELTPEQQMDPRWHPDYCPTWDAFFINRRERALAKYEEDGPPPSNFNEAGRRLW